MKIKRINLNLKSIEAYYLACFFTGKREGELSIKEIKRIDNIITTLIKVMDWDHKYQYYRTILQMDWTQAEKLKPEIEKLSKAVKSKNTNKLITHNSALILATLKK